MAKYLKKYSEERPWGKFEKFCQNKNCTVKILFIKANGELSLQYHRHRDEFWKIIQGRPKIWLGNKIIEAKKFLAQVKEELLTHGKEHVQNNYSKEEIEEKIKSIIGSGLVGKIASLSVEEQEQLEKAISLAGDWDIKDVLNSYK